MEDGEGAEAGLTVEDGIAIGVFAVVFLGVLTLTIVTLYASIKIVHHAECMVIERVRRTRASTRLRARCGRFYRLP